MKIATLTGGGVFYSFEYKDQGPQWQRQCILFHTGLLFYKLMHSVSFTGTCVHRLQSDIVPNTDVIPKVIKPHGGAFSIKSG